MSSQTSSFPGLCFHHTPPALLATNSNRYLWNFMLIALPQKTEDCYSPGTSYFGLIPSFSSWSISARPARCGKTMLHDWRGDHLGEAEQLPRPQQNWACWHFKAVHLECFFVIFPFLCFNGSIVMHDAHRPFWYLNPRFDTFLAGCKFPETRKWPMVGWNKVHYISTWQLFGRFNRHQKLIGKWFIRFILALSLDWNHYKMRQNASFVTLQRAYFPMRRAGEQRSSPTAQHPAVSGSDLGEWCQGGELPPTVHPDNIY